MQVAGIAYQKSPAAAIALSNQLVRRPLISAQNLNINVKANEIDVDKLLTADYEPSSADKTETAGKNNIFKEQSQLVGSNEDAEKNKESNRKRKR